MEKKMETKQLNEVMRAAGKLREHEVPTDWPKRYRTDYAIKLAYALEAAGYLNEDWKPTPKLDNEKAVYVLWEFGDPQWRPSVYPLIDYWNIDVAGVKATKDSNFKSEINAIVAELREEAKAEKMALDYIPESRNDDEEETPCYIGVIPKTKMPRYLQKDLRKHLVSAIYSHLLTEKYNDFINCLERVQSDIDNEFNAASLEDCIFDNVEETFEKILSEVATDIAALLCRVSQPIK